MTFRVDSEIGELRQVANQPDHFSFVNVQVHAPQRLYAAEVLSYAPHRDYRRSGAGSGALWDHTISGDAHAPLSCA
jgi:hypothetical protein